MDQMKTGEFLKQLRKEKGLTQEQLAELFSVSDRTVSRWETGRNMPDLSLLIELADFYAVDIREIIDGERKNETMDTQTKDTLKKVAEYVEAGNKKDRKKLIDMMAGSAILVLFSSALVESNGFQGWIPESACKNMIYFSLGVVLAALVLTIMYLTGVFDRISEKKMMRRIKMEKGRDD